MRHLRCAVTVQSRLFSRLTRTAHSKSIRFGLMSNQEIQRVAEFHVFERNLYQMPQRTPLRNGILDPRLARHRRRGPVVHVLMPVCTRRVRRTRRASARRAKGSWRTAAATMVRQPQSLCHYAHPPPLA